LEGFCTTSSITQTQNDHQENDKHNEFNGAELSKDEVDGIDAVIASWCHYIF